MAKRTKTPPAPTHPAFQAMRAALEARPPRMFASDFHVHDVAALAMSNPLRPFAWRLYDNGTHLLWLDTPRGQLEDDLRVARTLSGRDYAGEWWVWDGVVLRRVVDEEVAALVVEGYRLRLQSPAAEVSP